MRLKWPNDYMLTSKARARLKELRKLNDHHALNDDDLRIVQNELDVLATMINKNKAKEEDRNGTL